SKRCIGHRARRVHAALSGRYIHVSLFARFECTLSTFENASELTHATSIARKSKSVIFDFLRHDSRSGVAAGPLHGSYYSLLSDAWGIRATSIARKSKSVIFDFLRHDSRSGVAAGPFHGSYCSFLSDASGIARGASMRRYPAATSMYRRSLGSSVR